MNIKVVLDDTPNLAVITGGGYALTEVEIHIDKLLPPEKQLEVLIHEILEVYLLSTPHDKIDKLTSILCHSILNSAPLARHSVSQRLKRVPP